MILRMKYRKTEAGRYLSHLDMARTIERTFRRAELPLVFSAGFNPHPKISFASALAVGVTSDGEYLDAELSELCRAEGVPALADKISRAAPKVIELLALMEIRKPERSLSAVINRARYLITLPSADPAGLARSKAAAAKLLEFETLSLKQPQGKNLRPWLYELSISVKDRQVVLDMLTETGQAGNLKPQDVLTLLNDECRANLDKPWLIHREGLYTQTGGGLRTPMDL
ncbi:MAG: TIGR03936 family radical SAM-associated protein [Peptococcaceae bacterium]|jgi:radical SAM-linked protein|nr:TIGR03936 family radical SAM-associated protein [Peptococcaceae bacterium]